MSSPALGDRVSFPLRFGRKTGVVVSLAPVAVVADGTGVRWELPSQPLQIVDRAVPELPAGLLWRTRRTVRCQHSTLGCCSECLARHRAHLRKVDGDTTWVP